MNLRNVYRSTLFTKLQIAYMCTNLLPPVLLVDQEVLVVHQNLQNVAKMCNMSRNMHKYCSRLYCHCQSCHRQL